ncbi:MAG: MurR/RpiR family transcriptional regulator [Parvibaculaceae bacterium]
MARQRARSRAESEAGDATIADTIRGLTDRLTRTERRIAQVLLSQYPLLGLETLARFAGAAQTTAPTVLRFVTKLGFPSYLDFQLALRNEMKPQFQSALNRHSLGISKKSDEHDYRHQFCDALVENVRRAREMMPEAQFEAVLDLLADVNRPVLCLGGRFSDTLAQSMYNFLAEMRPKVGLVRGQTETWPTYLLDVGRRHVVVIFDFRRYQPDVFRFAEIAASQGASIIVFTDEWMSGISRFAHHVVMAPVTVPSLYDSSVAALAQMEALIGALGLRLSKAAKRRIGTLEKLRDSSASRQRGKT